VGIDPRALDTKLAGECRGIDKSAANASAAFVANQFDHSLSEGLQVHVKRGSGQRRVVG
jgi:hypothetical protein